MLETSGGSGFIVHRRGLVLTNRHTVENERATYSVILENGEKLPAEVLSRDPTNDVAILKIEARGKKLALLPLGDSAKLELGQSVIAAGNALGVFKNSVSRGIISGLYRSISARGARKKIEELRGLIQTDAAINPGNSGGPLVNLAGKAIGINVAVISGAESIGFAIPINVAKRDLEDIVKYGRVRKPFLGVRYLLLDDYLKSKTGLPVNYGALVIPEHPYQTAVVAGSPAAKAGIQEKDIILEINQRQINYDYTIEDFIAASKIGAPAEFLILRGKNKIRLRVTLAEKK